MVNIDRPLTAEEHAGLERFFGKLLCLEYGHPEGMMEAFIDGDDARFRCKRCEEIVLGGN